MPLDHTLLICVSAHAIVVIGELGALHVLQELFIVSDDDELEIRLVLAVFYDLVQRFRERLDIVPVKVGGWFIKSNNLPAIRFLNIIVAK